MTGLAVIKQVTDEENDRLRPVLERIIGQEISRLRAALNAIDRAFTGHRARACLAYAGPQCPARLPGKPPPPSASPVAAAPCVPRRYELA